MSLTITIPGAVNVTTGAMAPAVLTVGVGVPGAQGPQGPAGPGVPVGGTAGQYLQKIDGTNYNTDWVTLNLAAYAVKANNLSDLTNFGTARTNLGLGTMAVATAADYSTTTVANGLYYPLSGNPSSFLTAAALSPYLTTATAASTYAVIAAGQPTAGTTGQVLTKNSGTNYDSSWATLIPGDRYLTSSTTSLTINNANKTLTIGTGLSYTTQQDIVIAYDAANHMHARVLTYNSGTGVMDVDVLTHSGSGTYATWTVNVGGAPALASVVWGDITGTLGNQTDLATALNSKLELAGGVLTVNSTIDASTTTQASVFSGTGVTAELSANPSENSSLQYSGLQVQNAAGTMSVTPAGLTFPNASTQTVAYPGSSGFLLKADNLAGLADTSVSRTNLGLGSMATATAADYSTTTVANGLYYPLSGNPSSFLVAANITGKANLASPAFTGNVTITSSTGAALFIEQTGTGNILTLHDQASDTTFVTIDANGKVSTIASEATNGAGFNIAHGVAPTTPVNGDIWTTTSGLFMRQSGVTKQYVDFDTSQTINGNKTFSNATQTLGNSTAASTINIGTGATLTATTKTINIGTNGVSGSTTNITLGSATSGATNAIQVNGPMTVGNNFTATGLNINIGTLTATAFYNFGTGALASGATRTIGIGTNALAGSTNAITIGSAAGTSTTTLQGNTNGVTAAADTNSVALATTAYVVGQAGSATPAATGTAAVGTSLRYARQDHVHPTDTSRAPLASPTFTGTPTLPTGTIATTQTTGNNTTAVATTAFVTAAVPAFGAQADVNEPLSTTKAASIDNVRDLLMSPGHQIFYQGAGVNGTLGAGAATNANSGRWKEYVSPNAGVAGYAVGVYDTNAASIGFAGYTRGTNLTTRNWSKKVWLSGRCMIGHFSLTSYDGSANTFARISLGGFNAIQSGDMVAGSRGIGWRLQGGGSQAIVLQVANGTTVTNVTSSFTPVTKQVFDWEIYSDGAGNVTLFVNDSQVATTTAGPTGTGGGLYMEGVDSTASSTAPFILNNLGTKIFYGI